MLDASTDQLRSALDHHLAGRTHEAAEIYRDVLSQNPNHPDALRLLGMVARQDGKLDDALDLIRRSIDVDPKRAETWHNLGDVMRSLNRPEDAASAYTKAAEIRPDWAEAHGALGNVLREMGNLDRAAAEFKKVIQLKPDLAAGYLNLGKTRHQQSKRGEAMAAYATALGLKPDWAEAHEFLGNALWDEGRLDEAVASYAKAIELKPALVKPRWSTGKILSRQGKIVEAIRHFRDAVGVDPQNANAHFLLGRMLHKAGRTDEASQEYREAIRLRPDTPEWRFKLAALSGDGSVTTAPPSYVRDLFDEYAPTFDEHLVDKLKYRAPEEILSAVLAATDRRRTEFRDWDILDLGCGTGLCGKAFKSYARRLVGIDLSPVMIHAATRRGIYDELKIGDVLTALEDAESHDLIVAGDVLIYIGDLTHLMPAVARALRPGGLFAFSIEGYEGDGFFLHSEQRFAHSLKYMRDLASSAGLLELSAQKISLRRNAGVDVPGCIMVFARPSGK
jgi:predicted TPR repeat methyltransferase